MGRMYKYLLSLSTECCGTLGDIQEKNLGDLQPSERYPTSWRLVVRSQEKNTGPG